MSAQNINESTVAYLDYLPKFGIEKFHGTGIQDASRWLMDLKAEFRDRGLRIPVQPNLWVEAIYRETDNEAAKWMDSTPHIRRIVMNYDQATANDAILLEQALKNKFPLVTYTESSKSPDQMLSEFSQIRSEPLSEYYGRALSFLSLVNLSDRCTDDATFNPSETDRMILRMLINKFISGLVNEELRMSAIAHGATTTESLARSYEIVRECRQSIDEIQKQLVQFTTQQ
ncbi:hypothetical protein K3495_g15168, partial [Podosphaera aphanis]